MPINSPTAVHLPWDSITFVKSLLRYRRTLSVSYSCLSYLTSYWILEFSEFVSFAVCSLFFMFIIHNRFRIIDAFIARNESTYIGTKSAYSANLWSKVCRVSEVLRSGVHVPSNRRYAEKWHYNQGYWNNNRINSLLWHQIECINSFTHVKPHECCMSVSCGREGQRTIPDNFFSYVRGS